jgi:hypothetical protein
MNKRICAMILGTMFAVSGLILAQDSPNLLKNSDLKIENNILKDWSVGLAGNCKYVQTAGYKGKNSVLIPVEGVPPGAPAGLENSRKEIMTQTVSGLKPGKYIFSAYIKLNRKIDGVVLIRIIQLAGKEEYEGPNLKGPDQPEPEVWGKVMAEFNIPAGASWATIAFDFRDISPGATVCVDSPSLTYKPE